MHIGVSLSPAFLCGRAASHHQEGMLENGVQSFLLRLREAGCTHIELRAVRADTPEEIITGSADALKKAGLLMTVHGALKDESAASFWGRLDPLLAAQENLCVTVHSASTKEETLRLLRRMGEYTLLHHPGAKIALENNRSKKGDNIDLVECGGVCDSVEAAALSNLGTCWDFGHFYWDHLAHPSLLPEELPPEAFLARTVHTHIHSVCENTTHFPLTAGCLPLRDYLSALLRAGYRGVFNLEPEPERWAESVDAAEEIVRSVSILKTTLLSIKEENA